jgi:hypothetical protein
MKKIYEVLVAYDPELGRDVRCRSDIDTQGGFTRLENGTILHRDSKTKKHRLFMRVYQGPAREAHQLAGMLKLAYDGLGIPHSILRRV